VTHRLHKGRPKTANISTLAVLEAVERCFPILRLTEDFQCCEKVAKAALDRENKRGLIENGRLTPAGQEWLRDAYSQA
jgi:hypothetical protein